ncbi:helix-turn-helix transcriptional regulator [Patulibacter sp. NPDC049589]|uniref:helix-turn-helix domain-containing protein n=1 Tax=Patulibacter sp. NPDC049589 TaxID=3154731 RepID=UPI003431EDBD
MSTFAPSLRPARTRRPATVTARELEIIELVVDGLTNPEIGLRLEISPRTVQSHLASAMRKLGTRTRTQLAVSALRAELVELHPAPALLPAPVAGVPSLTAADLAA